MNNQKYIRKIIISLLTLVFLFSTGMIIKYVLRSYMEQQEFNDLAAFAKTLTCEENRTSSQSCNDENCFVSPYISLKEQNDDFFGWISIDGTRINYPVMYTPDDSEYYLRRSFNKSNSTSGVPFLDANCFIDCGNYLIYGHNMFDGSMFADLLCYADEKFYQQHPTIHFDTLDGNASYTVIAAFYTEIYPIESNRFNYFQYTDLRNKNTFNSYVKQVKEIAIYDTGITPQYGDSLLTLSTCSYHTEEGRFVVVARENVDN